MGARLEVTREDETKMRSRPCVLTNLKTGAGFVEWLAVVLRDGLFSGLA